MNISQLEGIINENLNITGDRTKLILNKVGRNNADMILIEMEKGIQKNLRKRVE